MQQQRKCNIFKGNPEVSFQNTEITLEASAGHSEVRRLGMTQKRPLGPSHASGLALIWSQTKVRVDGKAQMRSTWHGLATHRKL